MAIDNQQFSPGPRLETREIGAFGNPTFHIAYYQRGYRWKKPQVRQLLDDIDSFQPTHKALSYFLQALVLAEKSAGTFVVDGQQRLTTISLIQKALGLAESFSLVFQRNPEQTSMGSIDTHYREEAGKAISDWFQGKSDADKRAFAAKLNKAVFLVYRIKAEEELAVFGRLNSGKIAAKDSELVKYIMLTTRPDEPISVTQARAQEWDQIERALADDAFFSFFVKRGTWGEDDRMAMLFCFAGLCQNLENDKASNEVFPFLKCIQDHLASGVEARKAIWKAIYGAYYLLAAWFDDPVLYHAVGWHLHRVDAPPLATINPAQFLADMTKSLESIASFVESATQEDDNKHLKDVYYDNPNPTRSALLLYNVAFCRRRWPQKYDFQKHREVDEWSLEHIVARNEKKLSEEEFLNFAPGILTKTHWQQYKDACAEDSRDAVLSSLLEKSYPAENDDTIRNLALLSKGANSSLNNALFERKRVQVRDWADQQAYWIPPATQAVFFKTIPGTDMSVHFWSTEDKRQYGEHVKNSTSAFVNEVKKAIDHE
jgi:hypothetical protein